MKRRVRVRKQLGPTDPAKRLLEHVEHALYRIDLLTVVGEHIPAVIIGIGSAVAIGHYVLVGGTVIMLAAYVVAHIIDL